MGLLQNVLGQGQWDRQLIATQLAILIVSALSLTVIRRLYFSPLKSIPGPFLASISRWWHLKQIVRGDQQVALAKEHEKYGEIYPETGSGQNSMNFTKTRTLTTHVC